MEKISYQQKIKSLVSFIEGLNSIQQGNFDKAKECLSLLSTFIESLKSSTPDYENIMKFSNDGMVALKEIIDENHWKSSLKARLSKVIMAWLRSLYIYVRNSYIKKFASLPAVTINPDGERVKAYLSEGDKEGVGDEEYTKIYANSLGPYFNDDFFKEDKLRIVWLLKESYIESKDYETWKTHNDYGGNDLAAKYAKEGVRGNSTHQGILAITRRILEKRGIIPENVHNMDKEVMNHICILEMNYFPGLDFNSDNKYNKSDDEKIDSSLIKWSILNGTLQSVLVDFYLPKVVLGHRASLSSLTEYNNEVLNWDNKGTETGSWSRNHFFNFLEASWEPDKYPELEIKICKRRMENKCRPQKISGWAKYATAIFDNRGCLWAGGLHPSAPGKWGKDNIEIYADWINSTLNDKN